jgi:itaconyl-CoA hydratase
MLLLYLRSRELRRRIVMEQPPSAYREIGPKRYRETNGLYYENFEVGDTFEHRPGRTITDVDNIWITLLTMNVQPVHFDAAYAA